MLVMLERDQRMHKARASREVEGEEMSKALILSKG